MRGNELLATAESRGLNAHLRADKPKGRAAKSWKKSRGAGAREKEEIIKNKKIKNNPEKWGRGRASQNCRDEGRTQKRKIGRQDGG